VCSPPGSPDVIYVGGAMQCVNGIVRKMSRLRCPLTNCNASYPGGRDGSIRSPNGRDTLDSNVLVAFYSRGFTFI
jgi:hypothetical protein